MVASISQDLRRRVVEAYKSKEGGYKKLAARFNVSLISVRRWVDLERKTQSVAPRPYKAGPDPKILKSQWSELKSLVAEKPDRTLRELSAEWKTRYNVGMHISSMSRALNKAGMRFKKNI